MNGYWAAAQYAPQVMTRYGGPVGLAGKLVGLGIDELEAGVPWWSWLGVGAIAGAVVTLAICRR